MPFIDCQSGEYFVQVWTADAMGISLAEILNTQTEERSQYVTAMTSGVSGPNYWVIRSTDASALDFNLALVDEGQGRIDLGGHFSATTVSGEQLRDLDVRCDFASN